MVAEALALTASRRPAFYARWRHVLYTAAAAQVVAVTHSLVMRGELNVFSLHHGSPLLLLLW